MYLTACGLVCSVGLQAKAACAAVRAGIGRFVELPYHHEHGESVIGAPVPELTVDFEDVGRLSELLSRALSECLAAPHASSLSPLPLLVGLAETGRPGSAAPVAEVILAEVQRNLGTRFHGRLSQVIHTGHTSCFEALRVARRLLSEPDVQGCIVCGVDSYLNAKTLHWLERGFRLKTEENSDGVIPGEAAAAVFVQGHRPTSDGAAIRVSGIGFGHEPANVLSEEPLCGLGLTGAIREALAEAALKFQEIDFRISDVSGESYGFREQALAVARLLRAPRGELPFWHCADSIGDVGAAAGACALVVAMDAFAQGYAPGKYALCSTSAVGGNRAAVVLNGQVA
jgi:3-oxoacyl-[acyl-carrier-protein] synthase I